MKNIGADSLKYEMLTKLTEQGKLTLSDVKAMVACIRFILESSLRSAVDPASLDSELQQLGFPKVCVF